jgi:hypothetical protein
VTLDENDTLDAVLTVGAAGRTLNITDAMGTPLTTGAGAVLDFVSPRQGEYIVQVTSPTPGPYVLALTP